MSVARTRYYCPVEVTVDVIGGRWTPVILAHLKEGVHRYGELRRRMPDLTEKMLTQRLRELERAGLVTRTVHDGLPAPVTYDLTDEGRSLAPVLEALYAWGEEHAARHGIAITPAE
ncbi:winged helix-turn-helix transcriptional regulator [Jiangella alkaliphila]|uniref:DNA-binding transcriptional regulator, HxlR family n=1 Tax=Jiangella alkaliphila TaxID=419479 RepID=A0A1H2IPX4_9ACTN|nr:helix-turn-helix domain-containing protein [Jiangella alkaliphila]SDU46015.1 DNA-binding transcriptional regulator, HxlR family [Jiangella alkaliphila]